MMIKERTHSGSLLNRGATLAKIAKAAGVSRTAVSVALRGGKDGRTTVSESVRHHILKTARDLHYRPYGVARALRSGSAQVIGFVAWDYSGDRGMGPYGLNEPFLLGMSHYLVAEGFHIALAGMGELEIKTNEDLPAILRHRFYDGLVIHDTGLHRLGKSLTDLGVPLIWWDSAVFEPTGCIYRDERQVGQSLTRHLIELGHRRITMHMGETSWQSYQAGKSTHFSYTQRYESYLAEMRAQGLEPQIMLGYSLAAIEKQLLEQRPTAVLTHSTGVAQIVNMAALKLGWRVPEDLSTAACDKEANTRQAGPDVGGMIYDRYAAGRQAAQMQLAALRTPGESIPSHVIRSEFYPGDTVAPPPAQGNRL